MPDERKAIVRIKGTVQGVGFRVWAKTEAEKLGLSGWVRNEGDGSVTALIAGCDGAIETMMAQFWKGPPGASVSSVIFEDANTGDIPSTFSITG